MKQNPNGLRRGSGTQAQKEKRGTQAQNGNTKKKQIISPIRGSASTHLEK
jgi:hypothetical protein